MKRFAIVFFILSILSLPVMAQSVSLTSSNLPIVVINTNGQEILDDPKIVADMGIIFNGAGVRNNITDSFNNYNGKIGIEIRGHSSQMFPMKAYSIELDDTAGNSLNKSLVGMPKESDWVLYAPYTDKTLMRNFLAYTLSQQMGHWAARCQFVEVVLNGDYIGVYVLLEKIKKGKDRVNITKMAATDTSGANVTGGYIFSLDKDPDAWVSKIPPPNSTTGIPVHFSYVYPKVEDIVTAQADYIENFTDSFETALQGEHFMDTSTGFRKFIDVPSFIDYSFINEVSRNVDGYRLSSYFNKDRNGKIFAGPVWDYDLAFRNADYCNGSDITGWAYQFNNVCPGDGAGLIPFWWTRFMQDSGYLSQQLCRWKDLRQNVLSENNINHLIDSINTLVAEAQVRHFQQWPILGQYVWPNPEPIPTTYEGEISALKTWISERLTWIDNNMANKGACSVAVPVTDALTVTMNPNPFILNPVATVVSKTQQRLSIQAIDAVGKIIYSKEVDLQIGTNSIPIPAFAWSKGVYFFRFTVPGGPKITRRMMKQ